MCASKAESAPCSAVVGQPGMTARCARAAWGFPSSRAQYAGVPCAQASTGRWVAPSTGDRASATQRTAASCPSSASWSWSSAHARHAPLQVADAADAEPRPLRQVLLGQATRDPIATKRRPEILLSSHGCTLRSPLHRGTMMPRLLRNTTIFALSLLTIVLCACATRKPRASARRIRSGYTGWPGCGSGLYRSRVTGWAAPCACVP